jgi:type 1 glutamine amidotransferase
MGRTPSTAGETSGVTEGAARGGGCVHDCIDPHLALTWASDHTVGMHTHLRLNWSLLVALLAVLFSGCQSTSPPPGTIGPPVRVFIRASAKTHGPGEHDYPRFLADWTKLLNERGVMTEGALTFPTEQQLTRTDVLLVYAADAGSMSEAERARLQAYVGRGGGIVVLHDGVCGKDAEWFKTVIGGAKQHGVTNWSRGNIPLHFENTQHPITRGVADFELDDEMFYRLQMMPGAKVLATTRHGDKGVVPQMWVYEKGDSRAFVWCQGHYYSSFSLPHFRSLLLRGIAWAGRREVDSLTAR